MPTQAQAKGFTLIELLLTVGLLTISAGVTTDVMLAITRSYNKTQITNEIEQNANFFLLKIEKELRNATSITEVTDNSITFTDRNNMVVVYTLNTTSNTLFRSFNGGTSYALSNNDPVNGVAVSCFLNGSKCFELVQTSPAVVQLGVRYAQIGSLGGNSFTGRVDLNNTIVSRGTY